MDDSSDASKDMLNRLNREEVERQAPLVTYLVTLAVAGVIGNSLVCYIYKRKYRASNCRTFIIVLSIVDVFISVVVIPVEVLVLFRQYNFQHAWICKLTVFLNTWPTLTCGFLLLVIAVDRYRKVCKPFCWQISHSAARTMWMSTGVVAVAFSWISPVIYSVQTTIHSVHNVTVSQCVETEAMKKTMFPLINNIFFSVLFLGALAGIIVMYCLIAIRVRQHVQRKSLFNATRRTYFVDAAEASEMTIKSGQVAVRNTVKKCDLESSDMLFCSSDSQDSRHISETSGQETNTLVLHSVDAHVRCAELAGNRKSVISRVLSFGRHSIGSAKSLSTSSTGNAINPRPRKQQDAQKQKRRTAFIMCLISLAFIVSYLPLLCLLMLRTADGSFVSSLTDTGRTVYKFALRSYYLNCAINPVIYGFWDSRFRKSCKNIICNGKC